MFLTLILDNIRSVQNVGSLFRTANCFAVNQIILCGITPCPTDRFGRLRPDFQKVSLGADSEVKWRHVMDTLSVCSELRDQGYRICSIEQSDRSVLMPNYPVSLDAKYALVLGNEVTGVSREVLDCSDVVLEIPQFGSKESLNVCNAGAIALYQFRGITGIL